MTLTRGKSDATDALWLCLPRRGARYGRGRGPYLGKRDSRCDRRQIRKHQRRPCPARGSWLVRHKGNYWALGEDDDVAAYTSMLESTRAANDRFGEEDMDEWMEHAVDDEDAE